MRTGWTIFLWVVAIAIITFIAIYEPLTQSTRERRFQDGIVFQRDPAKVESIRVTTGDNVFEIRRKGDGWQLGPDLKDRADPKLVNHLLQTICGLTYFDRMKASEFKKEDDLAPYGLSRPKRKIEIRGGGENATLYLGKDAADDSRLYARLDDARDVFLIDDEVEDTAFRDPADFRDRRLTDLDPSRVDRFTLRRDGGLIEVERTPAGWRIVKPLNAPADDAKVQKFLGEFLALPIEQFVADDSGDLSTYGVNEGQREISIYADGLDRPQSLRLGSQPPGFAGSVYAQATGRDSVCRVPARAADLLATTPDSLRDKRLLPINIDMVDGIRIDSPRGKIELRRQGDGWIVNANGETHPANAQLIYELANALGTATVQKYTSTSPGKPACSVSFEAILSENTPETTAGEHPIASVDFFPQSNGTVTAQISDTSEAAIVPQSILDALPLDPKAWQAK